MNSLASSETLWKPLCISKWPELKLATEIEKDPFPAWKNCYQRKHNVADTSLNEIMKEFHMCDWYSCPNGHMYLIGECRIPIFIAKCPTCGVRIGGRNHSMLKSNRRHGAVSNGRKGVKFDEIERYVGDKKRKKNRSIDFRKRRY